MKKVFLFAVIAALFVGCAADEDPLKKGNDNLTKVELVKKDNVVASFGDFGKLGVTVVDASAQAPALNPFSRAVAESTIDWKNYGTICKVWNNTSGHTEQAVAVRDEVTGNGIASNHSMSLGDQVQITPCFVHATDYEYYVADWSDNTMSTPVENPVAPFNWFAAKRGDGTIFSCTFTGTYNTFDEVVTKVSKSWFDAPFNYAKAAYDYYKAEALKMKAANPTDNDVYEINGYHVVLLKGIGYGAGEYGWEDGGGVVPYSGMYFNGVSESERRAIAEKVLFIAPDETEYTINCDMYGTFLLPEGTLTEVGALTGMAIADTIIEQNEFHTPLKYGIPEIPNECDGSVNIELEIPGEYIIIADDFAIHNGDLVYENVAIDDHKAVSGGNGGTKAYLTVTPSQKVKVSVEDLCELYESYIGKKNEEGNYYINQETHVLTLEVYLWPGTKDAEGNFTTYLGLNEGYLIGSEENPVDMLLGNENYSVKVSAYKGYQGRGAKDDGTVDNEGWSYVKVSIHIQPREYAAE